MRSALGDRQDVEARVAEVRRELAAEHEHVMSGLEKLKRRLERHLKKIDESPLKRPPSLIHAVAALLDCALDKYDELLEQRPHTPDVAEVRREMSEEHAHVMSGLEKLKRRLERHL